MCSSQVQSACVLVLVWRWPKARPAAQWRPRPCQVAPVLISSDWCKETLLTCGAPRLRLTKSLATLPCGMTMGGKGKEFPPGNITTLQCPAGVSVWVVSVNIYSKTNDFQHHSILQRINTVGSPAVHSSMASRRSKQQNNIVVVCSFNKSHA